MREIKFRAWDVKNKRYLTTRELYDSNELNEQFTFNPERNSIFILEQYTGLKDKNGKEIYEGDIIRATFVMDMSPGPISEDTYIMCVVWLLDGFVMKNKNSPMDECPLSSIDSNTDSIEIVGNIYENTELLENK